MKKRACSFVYAISLSNVLRVFWAIIWEIRTIKMATPGLNRLNERFDLRITKAHILSP